MGPKPHGVDLGASLVGDPRVDQIVREHVAFQEELVVRLERVDRLLERAWDGRDLGELLRGQLVEVRVDRQSGLGRSSTAALSVCGRAGSPSASEYLSRLRRLACLSVG